MLEETIKSYFTGRNDVAAVFLFGSHVGERVHTDSDVDVAILLTTYDPGSERARRALYMACEHLDDLNDYLVAVFQKTGIPG